jgi:4-hydroxy-2-oxoheptanedioate aldolase
LSLGALFVAVGLDTQILMRQTTALAAKFKDVQTEGTPTPATASVY